MKRMLLRVLLLAAVVSLLLSLPALAEAAEVTRYASNLDEFQAALDEANQMAANASAAGTTMDWMNIVLEDDIFFPSTTYAEMYIRLRISSAEGQTYRLVNNQSPMAAIIFALPDSILEVTNVIFDGSHHDGSALLLANTKAVLTDVVFENYASSDGIISTMATGSTTMTFEILPQLVLKNCIFRNNTFTRQYRAISAFSTSVDDDVYSLIMDNCTFTNNINNSIAFGIVGASGNIKITNCTFTGNSSLAGGAIYTNKANLTMAGCTFTGNQSVATDDAVAGESGGALHMQKTTAVISDCDFLNNYSDLSGGAVLAFVGTSAEFNRCNFKGNTAVSHGGVFCVADMFSADTTQASHITLNNCLLEGNKANGVDQSGQHKSDPFAPGGGAIYLHEHCTATLNKGTVIRNNYAKDSGGAVYGAFGSRITLDGAEIYNNHADLDGGAFYVDGAAAYAGYDHSLSGRPLPDDGFATGGKLFFKDGIITKNTAGRNGGGVYIGGENEVVVDGVHHIFTGGEMQMTGGVLTENTALDMGGGVYVGACDTGEKGGILDMTGGAIYLNVAGENGNTSDGADDAGADVYSEGGNAHITVVYADQITAYIRNAKNTFVPADHRDLYFTNWYDDYSDQDPTYGKTAGAAGVNPNTGRYKSSVDPHRVVYQPLTYDGAYNALILDYDRIATIPATGDSAMPLLWLGLCLLSAMLLRRRAA